MIRAVGITVGGRRRTVRAVILGAVLAKTVATIYRMDFDIEDEGAKDRVVKHVAERALAAYDSEKILELVSDPN